MGRAPSSHPKCIPHQLLEMVHNYIIQWANLAKDNNLVREFHDGSLGEYTHEMLMITERSFENIQSCLTVVGDNSTMEIKWSQLPPSFWSKIINPNRTTDPEVAVAAYTGMKLTPALLS